MIIDLILDRYHGDAYDPKEFYDAVMDYEEGTEYPISRAIDGGEEKDVKRELCAYIDGPNEYMPEVKYNPNIKKFINAVKWLEGDDGKDYSKEIDIMAEKKESTGKKNEEKIQFKHTEIPKELNHVYRACKKRFWCEPVLNNMVETGDYDVYNFSGEYGSYLKLLVVVEHTPDKYFVTVKGLDETEGYEYVELGKGEADTIQKATADAMAGVDKNMLPLAIKIHRAIEDASKKQESFVSMGTDFNPEFILARTFDEILGHTNDDIVIEDAEVAEALGKYLISDILAGSVSGTVDEFVNEVETLLSGSPLDGSPFGASEASDFARKLWNNSTN